jgi:hypothetical protein
MPVLFLFILGLCLYDGEWAKFRAIIKRTGEISRKRAIKIIVCYIIVFACFAVTVTVGMIQLETVEKSHVIRESETFIASEEIGRLETAPVYYEKYDVKIESLYDWSLKKWLNAETYGGSYTLMSDEESAQWGLNGYTYYNQKGEPRDEWAFTQGNEFVKIYSSADDLTAEQKAAALEELGFK